MAGDKIYMAYSQLWTIKEQLVNQIKTSTVSYDPVEMYVAGKYKLISNNEVARKQFQFDWNAWCNELTPIFKKQNPGSELYGNFNELFKMISSGWRIYEDNTDSVLKSIDELFDDLDLYFKSISKYKIEKPQSPTTCGTFILNLTAETVEININDVKQLCIDLKSIIEKLEISEEEKREILSELNDVSDKPADKGKLKKMLEKVHNGLSKHTPEMSAIGLLLKILATII